MKESQAARWLLGQLPRLVEKGVLAPAAADALRLHYEKEAAAAPHGQRVAVIVCALMGALLIGGGIILLLAHNWDEFGHTTRAILSFLPIVIAVGLSGASVFRKECPQALAEGAGTFHALAIGATIALVSQTYHMSGDLGDFILVWMLLGLPVIYILRCTAPALLYLGGVAFWAEHVASHNWFWGTNRSGETQLLWAWLLLALVMPAWFLLIRENRHSIRAGWFSTGLAICIMVIAVIQFGTGPAQYGMLIFPALFTMFYMVWSLWFSDREHPHTAHPFHVVGEAGIALMCIWLSYDGLWRGRADLYSSNSEFSAAASSTMAFALVGAATILWGYGLRRKAAMNIVAGALPVTVLIAFLLKDSNGAEAIPVVLMNLYAFALGITTVLRGLNVQRIGTLNAGLVLLTALITVRFFDADISFVLRGVGFIVIGIGFLFCNFLMIRKRKTTTS